MKSFKDEEESEYKEAGLEDPLLKKCDDSREKKPLLGAALAFFSGVFFTLTGPVVQN